MFLHLVLKSAQLLIINALDVIEPLMKYVSGFIATMKEKYKY